MFAPNIVFDLPMLTLAPEPQAPWETDVRRAYLLLGHKNGDDRALRAFEARFSRRAPLPFSWRVSAAIGGAK